MNPLTIIDCCADALAKKKLSRACYLGTNYRTNAHMRTSSHALPGTREVALGDFQHLDDGRADIRLRTTELRARRGLQLDERPLAVIPPSFP